MRITGEGIWGDPPDTGAARALLRRVVELGVNLIDTADSYGPEVSERLIREALHPYPEDVVVATKGGLLRDGPSKWRPDCRPEHLKEACEASLRRLRLDTIDLYQLHTPDPKVPFEESVGALSELREEGKVRHVGLSNVGRSHLATAREIVPIVSIQNRYSLTSRDSEAGARGLRERRARRSFPGFPSTRARSRRRTRSRGSHPATGRPAGRWRWPGCLQHSPVMVPIPGTSSIEHLEENVAAAHLQLSEDELAQVEAAAGKDGAVNDFRLDPRTTIGHVHLKVSDLERAERFYVDLLGFHVTARYGSDAVFLSAGDNHHDLGLNTWQSKGGGPPPAGQHGPLPLRHPRPDAPSSRRAVRAAAGCRRADSAEPPTTSSAKRSTCTTPTATGSRSTATATRRTGRERTARSRWRRFRSTSSRCWPSSRPSRR